MSCQGKGCGSVPTQETEGDLESQKLFDQGYYCAEAVLMSIAKEHGLDSPLIPAVATGFCSGLARTSGMCGAVTGGILALNLALGRRSERETVEKNYQAVQQLVSQFASRCGSANCSDLLGCDLGTPEGQQHFGRNGLWSRCRGFVGAATEITQSLIAENQLASKA